MYEKVQKHTFLSNPFQILTNFFDILLTCDIMYVNSYFISFTYIIREEKWERNLSLKSKSNH